MTINIINLEKFEKSLHAVQLKTPEIVPANKPIAVTGESNESLDDYINSLSITSTTRELIREGVEVGERSEAMMSVLCALARSGESNENIIEIFEEYAIGEKYQEKGENREDWLLPQIEKAREKVAKKSSQAVLTDITGLIQTDSFSPHKWTEIIFHARLNSFEINTVIKKMVERGLGTKTDLNSIWRQREKELDKEVIIERRKQELKQASRKKFPVCWDPNNYNHMLDCVEDGILEIEGKWPYFRYAGRLCYVVISQPANSHAIDLTDEKPPHISLIKQYDHPQLLLRAEQSVYFYKEKGNGPQQIEVPQKLSHLLLDYASSKAPEVTGLVPHPIVTAAGDYINQEGYDSVTGLYLDFGGKEFLPLVVGDKEDAKSVCDSIVQTMFPDFPWENKELDQTIGVSIFLTTLMRKTLDMAPGFLVKANLQGSGKTTLLRIIHLVVTGHDMPISTLSEDNNELRKSMLAHLIESPPMIVFDNVPDGFEIRSVVLPEVLTSEKFKDRILGNSKQVSVRTNVVIALTGNNVTTNADLSRRIIPLTLQPNRLNPERRSFSHPDIVGHARSVRMEMIQKGLSLVAMYIRAGSPLNHSAVQGSGYPRWDKMIRFPILWATGVDVWVAVEKARENSEDFLSRHAAVSALAGCFTYEKKFQATEVLNIIQEPSDTDAERLRDAFLAMGSNTVKSAGATGHALAKLLGFPATDGVLRKETVHNISKYSVERPKK